MQKRLLKTSPRLAVKDVLSCACSNPSVLRLLKAGFHHHDNLSTGDDISWSKQLPIAFVVFGVSSRDHDSSTSLASIACSNLLKFNSSLPAWNASSLQSLMSPTQSLQSNFHRTLLLDKAIRVAASDDTILGVTPEILGALRLKHPDAHADANFPPLPADINGFSASENDVVYVLRYFSVGSSSGIDCHRSVHLRDLTSESTAEAGQHLTRSLTALAYRLLSADLSDHDRKLLFSANVTAIRKKDGGIRPIAVGNLLRRLASNVDCAAVTPS